MRIEKLTDSSDLRPGQLLVVFNRLKACGSDVPVDVQFYRHRQGPIPWTGRIKNGRLFRHPQTTGERRANSAFQMYAGLAKALLQYTPNFLAIAIESELKLLLFASLNERD